MLSLDIGFLKISQNHHVRYSLYRLLHPCHTLYCLYSVCVCVWYTSVTEWEPMGFSIWRHSPFLYIVVNTYVLPFFFLNFNRTYKHKHPYWKIKRPPVCMYVYEIASMLTICFVFLFDLAEGHSSNLQQSNRELLRQMCIKSELWLCHRWRGGSLICWFHL